MAELPSRTPVPGGGLHLDGPMGLPQSEATKATHRWDTLEGVVDTVNRWGFNEAQTPEVRPPVVTADMLLSPDVKVYTAMYASLLVWTNYTNKLLARCIGELLQLENEMEDIAAETRKRLRSENLGRTKKTGMMSEKAIDDEINTHERFRILKIRAQTTKQLKIELDAQSDELKRSMQVVSRNIEVRKEEMEAGRIESGMPGRTGDGHRPWSGRG